MPRTDELYIIMVGTFFENGEQVIHTPAYATCFEFSVTTQEVIDAVMELLLLCKVSSVTCGKHPGMFLLLSLHQLCPQGECYCEAGQTGLFHYYHLYSIYIYICIFFFTGLIQNTFVSVCSQNI